MKNCSRRDFLHWIAAAAAAAAAGPVAGCGDNGGKKSGASEIGDRDFERPEDQIQDPKPDYTKRDAFLIYSHSFGNDADGSAYGTGMQLVDAAGNPIGGETVNNTAEVLLSPEAFVQRYFNPPADPGQDNIRSAVETAFANTILSAYGLPNTGKGREAAYKVLNNTFSALTEHYSAEVLGGRPQSFAFDNDQYIALGRFSNGDAYAALPIQGKDGNRELWVAVQGQVPNGLPETGRRYGDELDEGVSRIISLENIMGD